MDNEIINIYLPGTKKHFISTKFILDHIKKFLNCYYEYIIGTLYFRMGDVDNAIKYLEPVANEMEWHQGAQYNLGQALMRAGREEEANEQSFWLDII